MSEPKQRLVLSCDRPQSDNDHMEQESLSFGALRKAQRTLNRIHGESDSGEETDASYSNPSSSDEESKRKDDSRAKDPKRGVAIAARRSKNA
jgi:hypothetical protein